MYKNLKKLVALLFLCTIILTTVPVAPVRASSLPEMIKSGLGTYITGIAVDNSGNIIVSDSDNNRVQKINKQTKAVSELGAGNFNQPQGVAVDKDNNIYVADAGNLAIKKISSDGAVSTIPTQVDGSGSAWATIEAVAVDSNGKIYYSTGNNIYKMNSDGSSRTRLAASYSFYLPTGLAIDVSGNVYVADNNGNKVERINTDGTVTVLKTYTDYSNPQSIAIDSSKNIYICLGDYTIRKIDANGNETTFLSLDHMIPGNVYELTLDSLGNPYYCDDKGYLYESELVNTIKSISSIPDIKVTKGTALSSAGLPQTVNITLDDSTTVSAAVTWDNGNTSYDANTLGTYAFTGEITLPQGVVNPSNLKASVNVVVSKAVTTVASIPNIYVGQLTDVDSIGLPQTVNVTLDDSTTISSAVTWNNSTPSYDQNTLGTYLFTGEITLPQGVINPSNLKASVNVVEDMIVRGISTMPWLITTGTGTAKQDIGLPHDADILVNMNNSTQHISSVLIWDDGTPAYDPNIPGMYTFTATPTLPPDITNPNNVKASIQVFVQPGMMSPPGLSIKTLKSGLGPVLTGVVLDNNGNIIVSDYSNNKIEKVSLDGSTVTEIGDGNFNHPYGVAIDNSNNVYVADYGNSAIKKINSDGTVVNIPIVVAPNDISLGTGPTGVAVDSNYQIYYTTAHGAYRMNSAGGNVEYLTPNCVFAGVRGIMVDAAGNVYLNDCGNFNVDRIDYNGYPNAVTLNANLNSQQAVAIDSSNNLYVADSENYAIKKVDSNGNTTTILSSPQINSILGGITLDNSGNIYYCANNGTVCKARQAQPNDVISVPSIPDANVSFATPRDQMQWLLPQTVNVLLGDLSTVNATVTWDNSSTPNYDGYTAGTYVFKGTLTLPDGITNSDNLQASVNVIVTPSITAKEVNAVQDIKVPYGTAKGAIGLPVVSYLNFSDSSTQPQYTVWDNGTPTYDPNTAGTYVFSGNFPLLGGTYSNPDGLKASVKVIVEPGAPTVNNSTISPSSASFDKHTGSANNTNIAVALNLNGNTLSNIKNGTNTLVSGTDYVATGSSVTINKSYLNTLAAGTTTLTFGFSGGADQTLSISVNDSTPTTSTITAGKGLVRIMTGKPQYANAKIPFGIDSQSFSKNLTGYSFDVIYDSTKVGTVTVDSFNGLAKPTVGAIVDIDGSKKKVTVTWNGNFTGQDLNSIYNSSKGVLFKLNFVANQGFTSGETPIEIGTGSSVTFASGSASITGINGKVISGIIYGDANGDGAITSSDTNLINKYVSGKTTAITGEAKLTASDVDGDGSITAADAKEISNYISGKASTLKSLFGY